MASIEYSCHPFDHSKTSLNRIHWICAWYTPCFLPQQGARQREVAMKLILLLGALFSSLTYGKTWQSQDELTILAYSAPSPLNWSTPGELVRTTANNVLLGKIKVWEETRQKDRFGNPSTSERILKIKSHPHPISHINVRLACRGTAPIYVGMTSAENRQRRLL